jgi:hypothetical protein
VAGLQTRQDRNLERVIFALHGLVVDGPRDPEIARSMFPHGYDAAKWAEGQAMLAVLVSDATPPAETLNTAAAWCHEAAAVAHRALAGQPDLLSRLGPMPFK